MASRWSPSLRPASLIRWEVVTFNVVPPVSIADCPGCAIVSPKLWPYAGAHRLGTMGVTVAYAHPL
jgi:hypothetical protein